MAGGFKNHLLSWGTELNRSGIV